MTGPERKAITDTLERVQAIKDNSGRGLNPQDEERLRGVEQALLHVLAQQSHVDGWLVVAEVKIRRWHGQVQPGCKCGVCKRATT